MDDAELSAEVTNMLAITVSNEFSRIAFEASRGGSGAVLSNYTLPYAN